MTSDCFHFSYMVGDWVRIEDWDGHAAYTCPGCFASRDQLVKPVAGYDIRI